jgi:hypothetical protein
MDPVRVRRTSDARSSGKRVEKAMTGAEKRNGIVTTPGKAFEAKAKSDGPALPDFAGCEFCRLVEITK